MVEGALSRGTSLWGAMAFGSGLIIANWSCDAPSEADAVAATRGDVDGATAGARVLRVCLWAGAVCSGSVRTVWRTEGAVRAVVLGAAPASAVGCDVFGRRLAGVCVVGPGVGCCVAVTAEVTATRGETLSATVSSAAAFGWATVTAAEGADVDSAVRICTALGAAVTARVGAALAVGNGTLVAPARGAVVTVIGAGLLVRSGAVPTAGATATALAITGDDMPT